MGKDHKLVSKKWKMVIFKLGETNVKMKWSACYKRGTKKNLSPRQNSNLWPPKHRTSALSTWATENSWRARPYTRFILLFILRDHSTLPSIYFWGFGSEPMCRIEILSLHFSIAFKLFNRFWLSPVPPLNPHNRHTVTIVWHALHGSTPYSRAT